MAIDLIEQNDLGAFSGSRYRGGHNFVSDEGGYVGFLGIGEGGNKGRVDDIYGEAKGKYPFSASTSCKELQDLRDKITAEIDQQEENSHSINYKKKDQKVQADAAQAFKKWRAEMEARLTAMKCGDQALKDAEIKDAQKISEVIAGASQAAKSSAGQVGAAVASGTNMIIFGVVGLAFVTIGFLVVRRMRKK